jgi:hypothetical protein
MFGAFEGLHEMHHTFHLHQLGLAKGGFVAYPRPTLDWMCSSNFRVLLVETRKS